MAAQLPPFYVDVPTKFRLFTIGEYHTFSPSVLNEFRVGFNRYANTTPVGSQAYPGLDAFPNIVLDDEGAGLNIGPDPNAPQYTIQNYYSAVDNISWTKGKHTLKFGVEWARIHFAAEFYPARTRRLRVQRDSKLPGRYLSGHYRPAQLWIDHILWQPVCVLLVRERHLARDPASDLEFGRALRVHDDSAGRTKAESEQSAKSAEHHCVAGQRTARLHGADALRRITTLRVSGLLIHREATAPRRFAPDSAWPTIRSMTTLEFWRCRPRLGATNNVDTSKPPTPTFSAAAVFQVEAAG